MTTIETGTAAMAGLPDAFAGLGDADEHAAAGFAALDPEPFPALPPATCPAGPRAARTVAEQLAAEGHHSHLHADGGTVCLSGHCGPHPNLAEVLL